MNNLINITTNEQGSQVVSARELYEGLTIEQIHEKIIENYFSIFCMKSGLKVSKVNIIKVSSQLMICLNKSIESKMIPAWVFFMPTDVSIQENGEMYYFSTITKEGDILLSLEFLKTVSIDELSNRSLNSPKLFQFTYLMIDSNTGYCKIGKSVEPKVRERTLQSEKPTISMIAITEENIESLLHKKFAHKRIRGEWFDLNDKELEDLMSHGFKRVAFET